MPTYLHRPGLKIEAEFSSEPDPQFRYRMSAIKKDAAVNSKTVCAIMQNPSHADEKKADKSVQVLERVVFEKDYEEFSNVGQLIIVNQFAFIQTKGFNGTQKHIGTRNDETIAQAIEQSDIILIAWGKTNGYIQRKKEILKVIDRHQDKRLLQTSMHPSRVTYKGFIKDYDPFNR
jgi:hypothetical protein